MGCSNKPDIVVIEGTIKSYRASESSQVPRSYVKSMPLEKIVTNSGQIYELQREYDCKFLTAATHPARTRMDENSRYRFKGILTGDVFKAYEITRLN